MKRFLSMILASVIIFTSLLSSTNLSFADNEPSLTAQYAVLMDYETGKILYEKNSNQKMYPASTTKIWTAYLVLKNVKDLNKVVEIKNLPVVEGSSLYLKNGESFTVRELLTALLVHSANDVAYVLAEYVGGSVDKFVNLMNDEAKSIGATNTHFDNPHGLPDNNHYTTAHDMALMTRLAMSNETFREIVKTPYIHFKATKAYPYDRFFYNTNKFISGTANETMEYKGKTTPIKYDIVDGIKTGTTDEAGKCLLSSAVKNNMRLISCVFKSSEDQVFIDSRTLIDYGFENFSSYTIADKTELASTKKVLFTKQKELLYEPKNSYKVVLSNGSNVDGYTTKTNLDNIKLPVKKGDTVGSLSIYKDKKLVDTVDLVATSDLNSVFSFITENKLLGPLFKIIYYLCLLFVVILIGLVIRKVLRLKKRKNNSIYYNKNSYKKNKRR